MRAALAALALALATAAGAAVAAEPDARDETAATEADENEADTDKADAAARLCTLIEDSARRHDLPPPFLARLVWLESRFDSRAVSPKGALGVAQFMPATARRRGLADPFDPEQAIPAAAAYLAELRAEFGNLGRAAAAYNSGETRVAAWLAGRRGLPGETLAYVLAITHRPAAWFREPNREVEPRPLAEDRPFGEACRGLPVLKTRAVLFEGAAYKPWGVQVSGNPNRSRALAGFARVQAHHRQVVGGEAPMGVRTRQGGRRIWAVRLGADSRGEAQRLCQRLRAAGGACIVVRN